MSKELSVREAAELLLGLDNVLILTHRRPDGDTIGCAAALCLALRRKGRTAWVWPNEDAHGLFDPYFEGVLAPADFTPDTVVAVDTASLGMLPNGAAQWKERILLCIDHHGSNERYAENLCLDASAAACGELLYRIFTEMGVQPDSRMAMLLYMAIATDTGCFAYSNTSPDTHSITAALMQAGFDMSWVNKRHFRTKSLKRLKLEGRLVQEMELLQGGTLVFVYITQALLKELELSEEDLEDIAAFIGQVEGVSHSVTFRELKDGSCKLSVRTDEKLLNASDVSALMGGGGHAAAAGCTIPGPVSRARGEALAAIEKVQHG